MASYYGPHCHAVAINPNLLKVPSEFTFPLSNPETSVSTLLASAFPTIRSETFAASPSTLLSNDPPLPVHLDLLLKNSVPPPSMVRELRVELGRAGNYGTKSVIDPRYPAFRFPLWIVTWWADVIAIKDAESIWARAEQWLSFWRPKKRLQASTIREVEEAIASVRDLFDTIRFRSPLLGGGAGHVSKLALFLSNEWLNEDLIDGMVGYLALQVERDRQKRGKVRIGELEMSRGFFKLGQDPHEERPILRMCEQSVRKGLELLLFPVNVGGNHWVVVVVDFVTRTWSIGDSYPTGMKPYTVIDGLERWLSRFGTFRSGNPLAIGFQDDGYSCGICAINAIEHRVWPDTKLWAPDQKILMRIQWFCKVFDRHRQLSSSRPLNEETDESDGEAVLIQDHPSFNLGVAQVSGEGATDNSMNHTKNSTDTKIEEIDGDPLHALPIPRTEVSDWSSSAAGAISSPTALALDWACPSEAGFAQSSEREWDPWLDGDGMDVDQNGCGFQDTLLTSSSNPGPHSDQGNSNVESKASDMSHEDTTLDWVNPFNGREAIRRSISPELRQGEQSITQFFPRVKRKEWLSEETRKAKIRRVADAEKQQAANEARILEELRKKEHQREVNRQRKARQRAREKGKRKENASVEQLPVPQLVELSKRAQGLDTLDIASASRPHRQYKALQLKAPQGRKLEQPWMPPVRINWFSEFLWTQITAAATKIGYPYSQAEIVKELRRRDPHLFEKLHPQTLRKWLLKPAVRGQPWTEEALRKVERGSLQAIASSHSLGVLAPYPHLVKLIMKKLERTRKSGVSLHRSDVSVIIMSIIKLHAPWILDRIFSDGSSFKCSDSFTRKFLTAQGWSLRRTTRAAQKIPGDAEELCRRSFLRQAKAIRDFGIPAALRINTDQTNIVLMPSTDVTYNPKGEKQVAVVGKEEKRAFTLVVSVSASGELLPFQSVWKGRTTRSLPKKTPENAIAFEEAESLGFKFEVSGTDNYWCTLANLKSFVKTILVPYLQRKRKELGLEPDIPAIWQIDAWKVHRSKEFRAFMKKEHPDIILDFVPAGCTPIWQPNDVRMQRPLKHEIKRAAREDMIQEVMESEGSTGDSAVILKKDIAVLRDRAPGWLVKAFHAVNRVEFIVKAFEMCQVGENRNMNLSHKSLTSALTRQTLNCLPKDEPELWEELMGDQDQSFLDGEEIEALEADDSGDHELPSHAEYDDDVAIPTEILIRHVIDGVIGGGNTIDGEENLVPLGISETLTEDNAGSNYDSDYEDQSFTTSIGDIGDSGQTNASHSGVEKPVEGRVTRSRTAAQRAGTLV